MTTPWNWSEEADQHPDPRAAEEGSVSVQDQRNRYQDQRPQKDSSDNAVTHMISLLHQNETSPAPATYTLTLSNLRANTEILLVSTAYRRPVS